MDGAHAECASAPLPSRATPRGHLHGAAVVSSAEEVRAAVVPFCEEGLRAGDRVVVAAGAETVDLLHRELGRQASAVLLDQTVSLRGSRPPDAFVASRRHMGEAAAAGRRLRILAEVDFGDEPAGWREGERFEAVANQLVSGPVTSMCLYDSRRLPQAVVASAAETHPVLHTAAGWADNPGFREPASFLRSLPRPRQAVEGTPPVLVISDARTLPDLRHTLGAALVEHVPDVAQREDMHLGVSEIAANAFRHGVRPVGARVWADAHHLVCAVTDSGSSWHDPFSGYVPAHGDDLGRGGMGLWLARKLWDHVDVLPGRNGLTVRLSARLR